MIVNRKYLGYINGNLFLLLHFAISYRGYYEQFLYTQSIKYVLFKNIGEVLNILYIVHANNVYVDSQNICLFYTTK